MLKARQDEVEYDKGRLTTGIEKLESSNEMVREMKAKLVKMQPVLEAKAAETEKLLDQVATDTVAAEEIAAKVAADQAIVQSKQEDASIIQMEVQSDLIEHYLH